MKKNNSRFQGLCSILIISLLIMTPLFVSCGSSGSGGEEENGQVTDLPEIVKMINAYSDATTESEKTKALQNIAISSPSLGVLDVDGNQLNPDAKNTDINMTQIDMDLYVSLIDEGYYRTVGEVIDFLKEAGIVLKATGEAITFEDVQQDIQSYVNWSFANADDPARRSSLRQDPSAPKPLHTCWWQTASGRTTPEPWPRPAPDARSRHRTPRQSGRSGCQPTGPPRPGFAPFDTRQPDRA